MQVTFSAQNISELFEEWDSYSGGSIGFRANEQIIQFPDPICDGWIRRSRLCSGLEIVTQNCTFPEPTSLEIQETGATNVLRLGFGITGNVRGAVPKNHQNLHFRAGQFSVGLATDADSGVAEYSKGHHQMVAAYIDLALFNTLVGQHQSQLPPAIKSALDGQSVPLYFRSGATTAPMKTIIHQIAQCPDQGLTQQLYLESKVLEILALSLDCIQTSEIDCTLARVLKSDDIERVHEASKILLSRLDQPPSLIELARFVGLNDYKLKVGFRQVFGTTVFGYLYQHRMEQAKTLLAAGETSVATVAELVGYTSLSAFSAAFRRRFGLSPSAYQLRR